LVWHRRMDSTFTHVAAAVACLAICATTAMPGSLLKGTAVAVAPGGVAALLMTAVRSLG